MRSKTKQKKNTIWVSWSHLRGTVEKNVQIIFFFFSVLLEVSFLLFDTEKVYFFYSHFTNYVSLENAFHDAI